MFRIKPEDFRIKYILIVVILAIIAAFSILIYWEETERDLSRIINFPILKFQKEIKDESAEWKTYKDEEYNFSFKYPSILEREETELSYCDGEIIPGAGPELSSICEGTKYVIKVNIIKKEFSPGRVSEYYDRSPEEIKKVVINEKDFYIGKNIVYISNDWYIHTALREYTLQFSFGGNAYVLNPNSDILTEEEFQRILPILTSLDIK